MKCQILIIKSDVQKKWLYIVMDVNIMTFNILKLFNILIP